VSGELGRLWYDASRAVRRHRALLAAALTAAAVATALPVLAPAPAPTTSVVAARHDLTAGQVLAVADLVSVAFTAPPDGAVTDADTLIGRSVAGPVRRGEALTDVRLLGSGLVQEAGLVAAPVRLADRASATLLHAGDRVDVLAVPADGTAETARTVAAGLAVLSVPAVDDGDGALVVLATTPDVAARLAAAGVGSRLSVTVRGTGSPR
jgi:pilus assembly protein CpaB